MEVLKGYSPSLFCEVLQFTGAFLPGFRQSSLKLTCSSDTRIRMPISIHTTNDPRIRMPISTHTTNDPPKSVGHHECWKFPFVVKYTEVLSFLPQYIIYVQTGSPLLNRGEMRVHRIVLSLSL